MPHVLVRSVTCRMPRLLYATNRTIVRRRQRMIVRTIGRPPSSTIDRHDWLYDRSSGAIHRWSLPLIARFPTIALAIDILQSFVIARPRIEIDRRMRATPAGDRSNIADRSKLGPIATSRTIDRSAMFATIFSSGRIPRSISTRGRAITNDWRISMARAIVGNRATSSIDQRPMYDQSWHPVTEGTINRGTP